MAIHSDANCSKMADFEAELQVVNSMDRKRRGSLPSVYLWTLKPS